MVATLVFKVDKNVFLERIDKPIFTIGRSNSDHVKLDGKGISRGHATIYYANNSLWVIDGTTKGKVSTNGVLVNGSKITVHKLKSFDIITFSRDIHALYLEDRHGDIDPLMFSQSIAKIVEFIQRKNISEAEAEVLGEKLVEAHSTYLGKINNPFLDDLTRLPNRSAFFGRVKKSIEFSQKISQDYKFSVLFIDLDRFKVINDSLGHLIGDRFLVSISEKINHCIRESDMIARLGGDEFAVLLDDLNNFDEAIAIAKRIQNILAEPLSIDQHELYPSLSIGIALSSLGYQSVEEIIRDADTAMYHAKKTGRSRFVVFDEKMHQEASELMRLDSDLRKALDNQELQLVYQPIVSILERRVVGFEALIRWEHPQLGPISPATFIPIAEETNLIYRIGNWVLTESCKQLQQWACNPAIMPDLSINVNLSSKQLTDANLVKTIKQALHQYNLHPKRLKLEVTESILMENGTQSIQVLNHLRCMGLQIAIDDFGTGYSSLSYLHRLPIDTLKVDRSFISAIQDGSQNTSLSITHSIIKLAHSIGVRVVAEGVENAYHLAWLEQQRCDYAQGFLFSQPLSGALATQMVEQGLHWPWKCTR
ncbi:MAG: EAL domain-containing protein [Spirulina sp.]